MKKEFWKCSNNNKAGSYCKLQCAQHGLQLHNKQDAKGDHKRKCECNQSGCSWTGDDIMCTDREPVSTTTTPETTPTTQSSTDTTPDIAPSKTCGNEDLFDINGVWFCNEDTIQNGSICKLKCRAGFFASHPYMKRKCACKDGKCSWTRKKVECLATTTQTTPITESDNTQTCTPLEADNGYWKCSNQSSKGSKCNLMCFAGYEQVRTKKRCKCKGEKCFWTGKDRQCVASNLFSTTAPSFEQTCDSTLSDPNGDWDCTNGNSLNSKCQLKCAAGYRINAFGNKRRCRCSSKRENCSWTRHQIKCVLEDSDLDLWGESPIPDGFEDEKCPALITQDNMYLRAEGKQNLNYLVLT